MRNIHHMQPDVYSICCFYTKINCVIIPWVAIATRWLPRDTHLPEINDAIFVYKENLWYS